MNADVRPLAVFDLDGVLADVGHRVHFLERRAKDWGAFFRAAVHDPVWPQGVELLRAAQDDCEILYLTGRPEHCRQDTTGWLRRHGLPHERLVMRPSRDHRPARQLKPELLRAAAGDRLVAVVVDDDLEVCDAYESAGWPVLRATWAEHSAALTRAQEAEGKT